MSKRIIQIINFCNIDDDDKLAETYLVELGKNYDLVSEGKPLDTVIRGLRDELERRFPDEGWTYESVMNYGMQLGVFKSIKDIYFNMEQIYM